MEVKKMVDLIPDEEMAYRLVDLYLREVSRRGEKRQMGLDTIINAYFYTLLRLKKKKEEMGLLTPAVEKEEELIGEGLESLEMPSSEEQFDFE